LKKSNNGSRTYKFFRYGNPKPVARGGTGISQIMGSDFAKKNVYA